MYAIVFIIACFAALGVLVTCNFIDELIAEKRRQMMLKRRARLELKKNRLRYKIRQKRGVNI